MEEFEKQKVAFETKAAMEKSDLLPQLQRQRGAVKGKATNAVQAHKIAEDLRDELFRKECQAAEKLRVQSNLAAEALKELQEQNEKAWATSEAVTRSRGRDRDAEAALLRERDRVRAAEEVKRQACERVRAADAEDRNRAAKAVDRAAYEAHACVGNLC